MPACGTGLVPMRTLTPGRQAGLAAVDRRARRSSASQPPQVLLARIIASATIRSSGAPRWRVRDLHLLVAAGSPRRRAIEAEVVVGPVEVLGLAAHHLALRLQVPRQAEQEGQLGGEAAAVGRQRRPASVASVTTLVELVVAQVGGDRHALEPGLRCRAAPAWPRRSVT